MSDKAERNAEIFRRYQAGESGNALALAYGISRQAIDSVVRLEGARRGEGLRPRLRRGGWWKKKVVPPDLLRQVAAGEVTIREAAARIGVGEGTVARRLRFAGLIQNRWRRERERIAALYERFLQGELMYDLAAEAGTTAGSLAMTFRRYRLRTGARHKHPKRAAPWQAKRQKEAPA